ncbi:MAG: transketolase [Alphaproteobacteria bacterium]|nr:transketolase [Alphaproteobacteria bacterium]MCD8570580.1 transketolase [Alphaproteobacteria bacterium]
MAAESMSLSSNPDYKTMANAIRALSMDAVQKANSGHPGMPMGMADVATVLYSKFLKFDPKNPEWADRDRFVLSAGHGSMLLYALNYLTGYDAITLDEIKNFRQLNAITAGHPEVEHHAGIETTTGPLGQGIATAVGMAMAEAIMAERFGKDLVDHYTYVIAGDGCMQEGISHEACSLAGTKKLEKLIVLYDDNGITIDGPTHLSFTDDTPARFKAYGWDVQSVDGHDMAAVEKAIAHAKTTKTPSLICCKTQIGFGSPNKANSASAHGSPLGDDEIALTRKALGWDHAPFEIPADVLESWRAVGRQHAETQKNWAAKLASSPKKAEFVSAVSGDISVKVSQITKDLKAKYGAEKPKLATRQASGDCLEAYVPAIPELVGGSADLTGSNNTKTKHVAAPYQYVYYGVREFGMAAAMNGMALHGGIVPYGGTFMVFTDYCRPAIRLSALMKQRVVYVMTHDSIGLGEDGPTHQPVEHLASLRAMPNVNVFRPCDIIETAECWEIALNTQDTPSIMALTRQGIPCLSDDRAENMSAYGAYILKEQGDKPEVTLFATGSEVEIAHEAYNVLAQEGKSVRLVSVPCMDLFLSGDIDNFTKLVCNDSVKVAVEAGVRQGWDAIIGAHNPFIGMNSFGASAPIKDLYNHFGITTEAVLDAVRKKLK